jgi:hypothetical protein
MKAIGIVLIIAGILMFVFGKVSFSKEKKIADLGPLEINKQEKKTLHWPDYAGGIVLLAGVAVLVIDRKNNA